MTLTLKLNARNDIHLPTEALKLLNLGQDRILKAELKNNQLILVPVDLEPRYSHDELETIDKVYQDQKKKGLIYLKSDKDIDGLLK